MLPFPCAHSLCYSRWPLGCPGGEGRKAAGGGDDGALEGRHQVSFQMAGGKNPAVAWVEADKSERCELFRPILCMWLKTGYLWKMFIFFVLVVTSAKRCHF